MKKYKLSAECKLKRENSNSTNKNKHGSNTKNFDIREKRINIIFKIIYVDAAIFVSLFFNYKNISSSLFHNDIIFTGILSFLFCLLINLLVYIFNELKCLKIDNDYINEQLEKTENHYDFIFTYFCTGGFTHILLTIIFGYFETSYNGKLIYSTIFFSIILASVISNTNLKTKKRKIVCSFLWSLSSFCTFIIFSFTK